MSAEKTRGDPLTPFLGLLPYDWADQQEERDMKKALAVLAVAAAITLAGCGGGGNSPSGVASLAGSHGASSPTTTLPKGTPAQLYAKWADCMRQHGVQMADPTIDNKGVVSINASKVDMATFQSANTACKSLEDAARVAIGGPKPEKPDPTKLLKFARCMRSHGIPDFPDPQNGGMQLHSDSNSSSDINPNNPVFQKAQTACQPILGNIKGGQKIMIGGPGGPGGPAAGSGDAGISVSGGGK
jgi:hypothetical protein